MGTKKSNKLYAAAAALAVTASAVAPGLTADAATKVTVKSVTNPASISHYGGYTFAVKKLSLPKTVKVLLSNKKYENRSVKWGKVSYDKKYIGKYQTISGTVSGTTKKASIKVKLNNYPVDVVEPKLAPVAVGEKLNLPSTIDVKYKDGKVIARSAKSFNLTAEKTDKAGMMKLSYNYMGKNSSIKGSIAYEVKAAEITNVMNEIKDDMLSVSADVKYPAKDAKVEVLVYAFKDMTKEPIKVAAELKDGKLTAKSGELPAGTHAFAVKVGEVVSPAKDFVIEAPMVKEVKAINATQVEVAFNKAVDAKTILKADGSNEFLSDVLTLRSIDGVTNGDLTGELSADGKKLTITSSATFEQRYDVVIDKIKSANGDSVAKYTDIISISKDVVAPVLVGTERVTANQIKIKFSEPMSSAGSMSFKLADGTVVTDISGSGTLVDGDKAVVLNLSDVDVPVGKDITATLIGAADKAGNLLTPNPATVTFQKGAKDGVAPTVTAITQTGAKSFEIKFSEAIVSAPTTVKIGSTTLADVTIDKNDSTKVIVKSATNLSGDQIVTIAGAVDGSGEEQVATNRVVKFVEDAVAPKVVASKVVTLPGDKKEYLELTFDKNVTSQVAVAPASTVDATGSFVKNFVTTNIEAADIAPTNLTFSETNKKVVLVKLADLLTKPGFDVEGAKYSLDLVLSGVSSEYGIAATTATATFTRGKDGTLTNNDVVTVDNIKSSNNNTVVVTFDKNVDAESATKTGNYVVGGAVVESAVVNTTDKTKVTLTLKANSNTFSGPRNVTVQNVKAEGSTATMSTVTKVVTLNENVAPTVTAKLGTDLQTITLTFSEVVENGEEDDFQVYSDINKVGTETDVTLDPAKKSATIKLGAAVTAEQLTKGLSLKALAGIDIVDTAGNQLSVGDKVVISNN